MIKIERADNGFVVTDSCNIKTVVEDKETEAHTTQALLFEVIVALGLHDSDHDKIRCFVVLKEDGREIES